MLGLFQLDAFKIYFNLADFSNVTNPSFNRKLHCWREMHCCLCKPSNWLHLDCHHPLVRIHHRPVYRLRHTSALRKEAANLSHSLHGLSHPDSCTLTTSSVYMMGRMQDVNQHDILWLSSCELVHNFACSALTLNLDFWT